VTIEHRMRDAAGETRSPRQPERLRSSDGLFNDRRKPDSNSGRHGDPQRAAKAERAPERASEHSDPRVSKKTSLVFLDFDGVLSDGEYSDHHSFFALDPAKVKLLNVLIAQTGAVIVVTSSLRTTVREMRRVLGEAGLTDSRSRVVGVTPSIEPNDSDEDRRLRGMEISLWLRQRGFDEQNAKFVVLDDNDDMGDLMAHLVQTDPFEGLTLREVEQAERMLLEL
jgi:hypothetical protein